MIPLIGSGALITEPGTAPSGLSASVRDANANARLSKYKFASWSPKKVMAALLAAAPSSPGEICRLPPAPAKSANTV